MNKIYTSLILSAAGKLIARRSSGLKSAGGLIAILLINLFASGQNLTQSGFVSVLTPKYMASGTSTRLPVMYRATVTGLTPNTVYRYFTQGATNSTAGGGTVDFGTANPGAGNPVMISADGSTYSYSTGASLSTAGNYQTFTSDASGNYTGWFGFVNTGNARFTAGNMIFPTIVIGSNTGTTLFRRALDVSLQVLGFSASAGANNGSFLKETGSSATAKNLVAIYDNTAGTGRPVYISPVESIGATIASLISGYAVTAGSWNAIIPNTNANGIRRIEQLSVTNASIIGCATDENGVWPTGSINTVNPSSGTTAISINAADAPLTSCVVCATITVAADAGIISCPGGNTTVTVSATGGTAPYAGTGIFTVTAGSYTYNITDANGCTGSTTISVAAGQDTTKPAIYLLGSQLLAGVTGPSTTQSPYLLPSKPGLKFTSILSV
ncbi:MAG: hypothetical protein H7Y27_03845, partial [Gemmatimonadaceae bacterium]|nr:hypothetical protein [Chitinophagaceae bacterium]